MPRTGWPSVGRAAISRRVKGVHHQAGRAVWSALASAVFLTVLSSTVLLEPSEALAAPCGQSNNDQFFVEATSANGNLVSLFRHGVRVNSTAHDNNLDGGCPPDGGPTTGATVVKTAHLDANVGCKQLEIGTQLFWRACCTDQSISNKQWYIFTEQIGQLCGTVLDHTFQATNNITVGNDTELKISGVDQPNGTTDWHLFVNFLIGQGDVEMSSSPLNTSWNTAIPEGEDERFGSATGMVASFNTLELKKNDGTWVSWPGQSCVTHTDNLPGTQYLYNRTSTTSFDISQTTGVFC